MKTYSRKNSSYLKKAFISSNFNEMCRLCLSERDIGLLPIIQNYQIHYQEWIRYSVDVLIEEGDGLPPNICEDCLSMVEQTYLFKKKCKASDSKLREHLELLELEECKLTDSSFKNLSEDHENLFTKIQNIEENESSAVDSGGTHNEQKTPDSGGETSELSALDSGKTESSAVESGVRNIKSINEYESNEEQTYTQNIKRGKLKIQDKNECQEEIANTNPEAGESIVINKVKRYILKGEKKADDQEEDLTVCEVIPLDVRNEEPVLLDDSRIPESSNYINLDCKDQNGHLTFSEMSSPEKLGTRIQEIYQLWENEEEAEEKHEVEKKEEEEVMVLDVLWEEDSDDKNDKKQNVGLLEVNVEENGVVQMHRVYMNKNQIKIVETMPKTTCFKCFACEKQYPTCSELKEHLASEHKEAPDAVCCEICGKSFTCSNSLKRHMTIHTGLKPYTCKICERKFSQGSILKRHILTHEHMKPFNCHICKKSYTQKMNLLSHLKNHGFQMSTGSFHCKLCSKSFAHQSGLSRHIKLHKGVKFLCDHCKKLFGDSSALTRHIKAIHQQKS